MDKIMSLPKTKEFLDWKPEGYFKSVEELRQEIGPELSDDDLLLKILIPGKPLKKANTGNRLRPLQARRPVLEDRDFPREFSVDVDGEVFNVRISPLGKCRNGIGC